MRAPGRSLALDDSRPIWQSLGVFLIPLMLSNVLQSLGSTASGAYLGHMLGPHQLAAAVNLFPIIFFMISFLIGVSSASSVLIGQAFGAGDRARVKAVAGTTLGFSIGIGALAGILGTIFIIPLLHLIATPPDIIDDCAAYGRVIFASLPLLFTYLVYSTFLRGVGDSQTPFYFLIVSTALTMVLTPFLIGGWFGFRRLGVVGPAWGNVVATAVALAAMLVTLRVRHNPLAPDRAILANLIPRGKIVGQLLRIGIPTGIQLVTVSLAEVAVVVFVNHYGSDATAAYGAVNQIVSYVQFPAISLGIAASIFGAQTIGAKRSDRLRAIVRAAVVLCWVIEGILIVTAYVFSEQILSLFLTSPQTRGIAHGLLSITLWSYVIFGTSSVLSGVMRSSGAVLWPTTITVCAIWLVEVPVAYVLSYHTPLALSGVWYGYPAAFIVSLLGQTLYYNLVWKRTLPTAIT